MFKLFIAMLCLFFFLEHAASFTLTSTSFTNKSNLAQKYTSYGLNISPQLKWNDAPKGTKSFALIVDDPDAKKIAGFTFVHWMVKDIPLTVNEFPEGGYKGEQIANHFKVEKYMGPKPPKGTGVHNYHFKLYALSVQKLTQATNILKMYEECEKYKLSFAELIVGYEYGMK